MCIDVDYYVEDVTKVFGYPNPIILHTFNPLKVAGLDGDSVYTIKNNRVTYEVSGGARWTHEVWDWCGFGEYIRVRANQFRPWGFEKVLIFKVYHIRPWTDCPDRALVWLVPQYSYWRATFLADEIAARDLRRVVYRDASRPGWNSLVHQAKDNSLWISLGREGEDATAELPKVDFDILMGLQSAQSVTSRMIGMKYTSPHLLALVGQYYRKGASEDPGSPRIARPAAVRVHWPESACGGR